MAIERLTAEDRLMLWPDDLWPQEIGALAVLDGDRLLDPDGQCFVEAVRQVVAARLHLVPRLRQVLRVPRWGLGGPFWTDAQEFELRDHVRVMEVPAPGDEAALLATAERLRRRRLDRSRPLWELWLLTGLLDRRLGMYVKIHHALGDGIAAVATLAAVLDAAPDGVPVERALDTVPEWSPAPPPSPDELLVDNLRRRAAGLKAGLATMARPGVVVRRALAAWPMFGSNLIGSGVTKAPSTSLDRVVGAGRRLAVLRTDLDVIRTIARAHHAKVNDVLLAITAGGLRGLLTSRNEPVDALILPAFVPITLRRPDEHDGASGNAVAQMVVPLPIGEPDPCLRLRRIAVETAGRKAGEHPDLGAMLGSALARWAILKAIDRHPVSVTTADITGPATPVFLAGARLLEALPILPLINKVTVGVGALSYAGRFSMMVVADEDTCPDLDVFVTSARADLRTLTLSELAPSPARVGSAAPQ